MTDAQTDTPAPEPRPRPDIRRARGARTRAAMLDAARSYMLDGWFQPTSAEIIGLSGGCARNVFFHFDSLDALRLAAIEENDAVREAILRRLLDDCTRELLTPDEAMRVCRALVTGRAG